VYSDAGGDNFQTVVGFTTQFGNQVGPKAVHLEVLGHEAISGPVTFKIAALTYHAGGAYGFIDNVGSPAILVEGCEVVGVGTAMVIK
jgi:hypothetical protein